MASPAPNEAADFRVSDSLNLDEIERILASVEGSDPSPASHDGTASNRTSPVHEEGSDHRLSAPLIESLPATIMETESKPLTFNPQRRGIGDGDPNRRRGSTRKITLDVDAPPLESFTSGQEKPTELSVNPTESAGLLKTWSVNNSAEASIKEKSIRDDANSSGIRGLRMGCIEVIYKDSCRNSSGDALEYSVFQGPYQAEAPIPPTNLAIQNENIVLKTECYGTRGRSLAEQRVREEEDEEPPKLSSELPYHGNIINRHQWSPIPIQALILFVPLAFFVIVFITQFQTISSASSKNIVKTSKLLTSLAAYLVEEQAIASYICGYTTRMDTSDLKAFYEALETSRSLYDKAKDRVDEVVIAIQEEVGKHWSVLQSPLGSLPVSGFLDSQQLAIVRSRTLTTTHNWDIMMRYEELLNQVLVYRGVLILRDSIKTNSELSQTRSIFSTLALFATKSMELFFEELGLGLTMPCPSTAFDVTFLLYAVGTLKMVERTFLFPSTPSIFDVFSSSQETINILVVRLPSEIENVILKILDYTFDPLTASIHDLTLGYELLSKVLDLTDDMETLNDPLRPKMDKYRSANDYIAYVFLYLCFGIACIGLIWHAVNVCLFRGSSSAHQQVNQTNLEMRAATIRMHEATMKMMHLNVNDVSQEIKMIASDQLIGDEERFLYIGNRTVLRLEPYLPLPMVCPPPDVPTEALLYKRLFIRPTLMKRKRLVGLRLDFSTILLLNNVGLQASVIGGDMTATSMATSGTTFNSQSFGTRRRKDRNTTASLVQEYKYFERVAQIIRFTCEVSNLLLDSENGAYISQCGEDVFVWVNACQNVKDPCIIAYLIASSIIEYCERFNVDVPLIAACRGEGVMGNITSFASGGPINTEQHGAWTGHIAFDPSMDTQLTSSSDSDEDLSWKDFAAATEGMRTKKRFQRWLRQLLGMTLRDEDTQLIQSKHCAKKLNSVDIDADYEVPLPERQENPDLLATNSLTSFVVFGDILQETEICLEVARTHSQRFVGNESFYKYLLKKRSHTQTILNRLPQRKNMYSPVDLGESLLPSTSQLSPQIGFPQFRAQEAEGESAVNSIVWNVANRFADNNSIFSLMDIVAVRRRSIVVSVDEVMTDKERKKREKKAQRQKEPEEVLPAAVLTGGDAEDSPMLDGEYTVEDDNENSDTESIDSDEPIEGFTPYDRVVDVQSQTTTVNDNQAVTSKRQVDLHVFYSLYISYSERAINNSEASASNPHHTNKMEGENTVEDWRVCVEQYVKFCYEAEALSPFSVQLSLTDKSALLDLAKKTEGRFHVFFADHPNSMLGKFSAPRMLDNIKSIQTICQEPVVPVGLRTFSPFSVEAMQVARLHASGHSQ